MLSTQSFAAKTFFSLSTRQWKSDLRDQIHRELVNRPFQFNKRSQLFIRTHNEPVSVAAMRVSKQPAS
jgi:DNA recombination-dependent growth factor C